MAEFVDVLKVANSDNCNSCPNVCFHLMALHFGHSPPGPLTSQTALILTLRPALRANPDIVAFEADEGEAAVFEGEA